MEIAIVDSNSQRARLLSENIEAALSNEGEAVYFSFFKSGIDFVSDYRPVYDVAVIDTELPMMNGVTIGIKLRKIDPDIAIVFTSDTDSYALGGYEARAVDYLLRPIGEHRLKSCLKAISSALALKSGKRVTLRIKNGYLRVFSGELCSIEARDHTILYRFRRREECGGGGSTLDELEKIFLPYGFYRVNKSYLINPDHVTRFSGNELTVGGATVTISRQKLKGFKAYYDLRYGRSCDENG